MRTTAPAMKPIPPMPMPPAQSAPPLRAELPGWTPEVPGEDDFAQVAAQARLGVQRKVVDEVSRRRRQRLLTACGVAVAVAGVLVFLFEKFYDPETWAREKAIKETVALMAEKQKVTDDLTHIEIDIEDAITKNDLDAARANLALLIEKSPDHPRREFLQTSIDRAAELQKLAGLNQPPAPAPAAARTRNNTPAERAPSKAPERVARAPERSAPTRSRPDTSPQKSQPRTYGAPISEPPRVSTIALDAPINSSPTVGAIQRDKNFSGRTVEASDSAVGGNAGSASNAGSAVAVQAPPGAPAPKPPAAVDVTPAKILKRVTPVVGSDVPRKASGYVIVKFDIGDNGRVANVAVVESTPPGIFDDAALTAVRKWVYEPRKENGVAVSSQAKARLVFDPAN
jgi:TonB family protein